MLNRVDFYQGECKDLAIPAGRCEVFVEDEICPFLEAVEIVRAGWPEFGWVKIRYNPAAAYMPQGESTEQAEQVAAIGKRVGICQLVETGIGEVKIEPLWVFEGQVELIETNLGPKKQDLEITVRDMSAEFDRVTVGGRRIATAGGESSFNDGLECVFNEDGQPNASTLQVQHNGRSYTVFAGDGQEAKYWSVAEVLIYLLSEYLPFGQLQVGPAAYLEAITGQRIADELDVEGKSLLDALGDCCEQAELKFCFRPRQQELEPAEKIVFYQQGKGPSVELNLQYAGEQLSISRTNVYELNSEKRHHSVAGLDVIETIDIQMPIVATHYEVGDRVIASPDSRDILGVGRDNRSIFWIDRVIMDFEKQCTNLRILRRRAYE